MNEMRVPKATLGRLPIYLDYLTSIQDQTVMISATKIANALGLGEVLVRKDLASVTSCGRPKLGHNVKILIDQIEAYLCRDTECKAVIIGAGKLGCALLDYAGFSEYGINIAAAFDCNVSAEMHTSDGKLIKPMTDFQEYCMKSSIKIGIIAVPKEAAQEVCNLLVANGITIIWSFAQIPLVVPKGVVVQYENLALSLAHLNKTV